MRTRKFVAAVVAALVCTSSYGQAATSPNDEYNLSDKCGKRAEEDWTFRHQDRPGLYGPKSWVRYENHYSLKMKRCVVMHIRTEETDAGDWIERTLFDVNDHKEIARYVGRAADIRICSFLNGTCTSEREWYGLVRPYWEQ
jgi:hypothetical protein